MSLEKIKDMVDIFLRLMLIGVVPAFWQYRQLAGSEMAIKVHPLFHLKEKASIRIEDQGRTGYFRQ